MKIAVVLKGLEVNKTALFPRTNTESVRNCIFRMNDKGIGKFTTQKRDYMFAVTRLMMEVPDSIIERVTAEILDSEIEETVYNEFDENGIHYISEYSIKHEDNMNDPDENNPNPVTEKVWSLSISGFYNEIQISNFEDSGSEIIKL